MIDFFYYTFLDNMLIGSENPNVFGNAYDVVKEFRQRFKIKHMITLTGEYDEFEIVGLTRHHIPMSDMPTKQSIEEVFDIIDDALPYQEPVWLHCQAGIDRTGCSIGAYLVRSGYDPEEVIAGLLEKFRYRINHTHINELWKDKIDFIRLYSKT